MEGLPMPPVVGLGVGERVVVVVETPLLLNSSLPHRSTWLTSAASTSTSGPLGRCAEHVHSSF